MAETLKITETKGYCYKEKKNNNNKNKQIKNS